MKLDLRFEENQQNINVHFLENEEQINANLGEISVINVGQDGATFIPSVSDDGIISWTNDRGLPNPKPVNIKGEKGDSGVTSWNGLEDKPFGERSEIAELVSNLTSEDYNNRNYPPCNFVVGNTYDVIWNGESYNGLLCYDYEGYNTIGGGSYPFIIDDDGGNSLFIVNNENEEGDFTISIIGQKITIKKLDEKYLPDSVALKTDIPEVPTKVSELENDAGFITKDDIPESNGVTSWNDLTDKPFGDKFDFSKEVYKSMGKFVFKDASDGTYFAQSSGIIVNLISGEKYQLTVSYMGTSTYAVVEGKALYDTLLKRFTVIGEGGSFQYDGNVMSITVKSDVPNIANPTFAPLMFVIIKEGNDVTIPLDEKYIPDTIARVEDIPNYDNLVNDVIAALPNAEGVGF